MKSLKKIIAVLTIALFFVACGGGGNTAGDKLANLKPTPDGSRYYGGMFKMNETEFFRTLYPLNIGEVTGHRIGNQIYEGLVRLHQKDLTILPSIAHKWDINEDATLYRFYLNKGVKFHDDACFADGKGREVTAKDFEYCFTKLCESSATNKGYHFVKGRVKGADAYYESTIKGTPLAEGVTGIRVIDNYTFEIELEQSFSSFMHILAMPFTFVFPKEAVDKYGVDMRIKAVGTGPFYVKAIKDNEKAILLKNPTYWQKDEAGNQLPYLDGISWTFINDEKAQLLEFKQGNLDMVYRLPLEMTDDVVNRQGVLQPGYEQYQYQSELSMSTQYYGFLNPEGSSVFDNKKLRQAFSYAIDRQKIVDYVVKGAGEPAYHGIVPPCYKNYNAKQIKGYNYDPNKARKLLAEAGYPNGEGLEEITLQLNSGGKRNEQVAEAIQKMLNETLGVTIKIVKMQWAQHLENVESGKVGFWRAGWIADYPDPENFLTLLWSNHLPEDLKTEDNVYLNTFRYKGAAFDKSFEEALRTVDEAKRNELYLKAEQAAIDDAPLLLLFYTKDARLVQPYVQNYPQNPMEYRNLLDVYFKPKDGEMLSGK